MAVAVVLVYRWSPIVPNGDPHHHPTPPPPPHHHHHHQSVQGLRSHMFNWPGCEVEIRGLRPPFCKPYSWEATLKDFRCALDHSLNILDEGITDVAGTMNSLHLSINTSRVFFLYLLETPVLQAIQLGGNSEGLPLRPRLQPQYP